MTRRNGDISTSTDRLMLDTQDQFGDIYKASNLTRLQLLYWVGQKLRPESALFNTIFNFTIFGNVDVKRFQNAFQALLDHSDALRTVIEEIDGVPCQRVLSDFPYTLNYLNFSQDPEPEETFQAWLQPRCTVPLNIEVCAFDSALIKISEEQFVWYLNQHHIITDASSFSLISERLTEFYEDALKKEPIAVSGWPTFESYVEYDQKYRYSPQYYKAEAYWAQKLNPGPEPIKFYGRVPKKRTTRVQKISVDLGLERSQKLRSVARQKEIFMASEDLSLYNIFAALFFTQLHYMSGNHRLGFITPVHNRFTEKFKQIIGLVIELCPLQLEIEADDTFLSLIKKVKRETREMLTYYQYGSSISLQNESFDVMFNTYHMSDFKLDGIPVQTERIHPGHGSESLALYVQDFSASGKLELNFYFHNDIFDETQRHQTIQSFVQLIDTFLENNTRPINEISLPFIQAARLSSPKEVGKYDEPESLQTNLKDEFVPPRDQLELQLAQIWEEVLEVQPVGVKDNFFDLGGSSWLAVRLFAKIQEESGKKLPLSTLLQTATIEGLAEIIRQQTDAIPRSLPLVAIQPNGTKRPFFCVHGAGGHVLIFDKLARYLGTDQPFYGFQAKGVEQEAEPYTQIESMASYYLKAMREVQPEGPYLLGGYSMGGMVAFEMAYQLQAQNQEVALLVIIDTPAQSPHFKYLHDFAHYLSIFFLLSPEKKLELFLRLRQYVFDLWWLVFRRRITYILKRLKSLGLKVFKSNPIRKSSQVNVIQKNNSEKSQASIYRAIRKIDEINHQAFATYIPKTYQGRIVLIESSEGYEDPNKDYSSISLQGWDRVASDEIEVYQIPGNHNEIIRTPNVRILAEKLKYCLLKAQMAADDE